MSENREQACEKLEISKQASDAVFVDTSINYCKRENARYFGILYDAASSIKGLSALHPDPENRYCKITGLQLTPNDKQFLRSHQGLILRKFQQSFSLSHLYSFVDSDDAIVLDNVALPDKEQFDYWFQVNFNQTIDYLYLRKECANFFLVLKSQENQYYQVI